MRIVSLLALVLLVFQAGAGGMVGNGGDAVLQEFNLRGLQLSAFLHAQPLIAAKFGIDADKFLATVKNTKLSGADHLYLNGQEVDAINYPSELRIEVSRTRWTASAARTDSFFVERRIALHEFLWVYGFDDSGYAISNQIIMELEKSVGPTTDPDVQRLLLGKLCRALESSDFATAKSYLAWGLDLNANCPDAGGTSARDPLLYVLMNRSTPAADELDIAESLLEFGANPNARSSFFDTSIVVEAMLRDTRFLKLLFKFGADPNLTNDQGQSAFTLATSITSPAMTTDAFWFFFNNGGDVNLATDLKTPSRGDTPAREIVRQANNESVVEALLQTGKADWCKITSGGFVNRTIDMVRPEYGPLLSKFDISCPRFQAEYAEAETCEQAKTAANAICQKMNYKYGKLDPFSDTEECMPMSDPTHPTKFMARVFCSDY